MISQNRGAKKKEDYFTNLGVLIESTELEHRKKSVIRFIENHQTTSFTIWR